MEAAALLDLPPVSVLPGRRPAPGDRPADISIDGDRVRIHDLVLVDGGAAAFLAGRPAEERPGIVERAVRIGLMALQDAGVSVNVDVVRREFDALLARTQVANEQAGRALEDALRLNFADGDGRLPRTLEKFLGDRGALRTFVNDLFDETRRDSAIGRMRELLGTLLRRRCVTPRAAARPDAPRLAAAPVPQGGQRRVHAAQRPPDGHRGGGRGPWRRTGSIGRQGRRLRRRSSPTSWATSLAAAATCSTGPAWSPAPRSRSKKGDFVLTLDPEVTGGADVRVVVEAKDRAISGRAMRDELREARDQP